MAAIAVAGVGMMMVCCSSSMAALAMGDDDDKAKITSKTKTLPDDSDSDEDEPTLPSGQYVKLVHTVGQDTSAAGNPTIKIRSSTSPSLRFLQRIRPPARVRGSV